jgi:hypothetical protein
MASSFGALLRCRRTFTGGIARFQEISIPGCARIGAPRVGQDRTANEWILDTRKPRTPEEAAAVLKESEGYYAVRLVKCDGLPENSHGDLYEGADATSFRGAFPNDCQDVLSAGLLNDAWNHKFPDQAVAYGKALLAAADAAQAAGSFSGASVATPSGHGSRG